MAEVMLERWEVALQSERGEEQVGEERLRLSAICNGIMWARVCWFVH